MRINFRQGIVSHQSGGFLQGNGAGHVDLLAANKSVTVSLAHHDTNYTHSEDNAVTNAWFGPFVPSTSYYLYWDFNLLTFEASRAHTELEPVAQSVAPGAGNRPIVGVVPGIASPAFGSFEVDGQYILPVNKPFDVVESTGNNGSYTVQSATYSLGTGTTTIVVNEDIPDTTVDGKLTLDRDSLGNPLLTEGRTWFDTTNNIHYERVGNTWVEILRVFAAQLFNNTFISLSQTGNFTGTQIGNNNSVSTGRILFGEASDAIHRDDGTFFTTEDQFFTNQSRVDALRLESNVARAQSDTGAQMAAYDIVAWSGDGKIVPAQYGDTGTAVVGVLTETINTGEVGAVIIQGAVTNQTSSPSWTWTTVGAKLWISNGALTETDPHVTDPITYSTPQVPVARVLSTDTVIFEQGLGGVGPQGPAGSVESLPIAQEDDPGAPLGVTALTADPDYVGAPIAISTNHPILTGGDKNLGQLLDVTITTPTADDVLTFNGTIWVNTTSPALSPLLGDLSNVTLSGEVDGELLTYQSGVWVNSNTLAGDLTMDTGTQLFLSSYTTGGLPGSSIEGSLVYDSTLQTLTYFDGTSWVTLGGASALDDLSDVVIGVGSPPLTEGDMLTYQSGEWVNSAALSGDVAIAGDLTLSDSSQLFLSSYTTANLPPSSRKGSITYDITLNVITYYNGSEWVTLASILNELGDVTISGSPPTTGHVLTYDGAEWVNAAPTSGGINSVVEDTTPQLGGSLDVNGQIITSAGGTDVALTPDGSGDLILDGIKWPQADGSAGQVLKTDGAAQTSWIDPPAAIETTTTYGTTGALSLDTSAGTFFIPTGTTTGVITFSFTNPAASGTVTAFTLELLGAGDNAPVFPASVVWPGATEPTWTAGGLDIVSFITRDNGTTWYGMLGGLAFA